VTKSVTKRTLKSSKNITHWCCNESCQKTQLFIFTQSNVLYQYVYICDLICLSYNHVVILLEHHTEQQLKALSNKVKDHRMPMRLLAIAHFKAF
jgi:hypothetical protein